MKKRNRLRAMAGVLLTAAVMFPTHPASAIEVGERAPDFSLRDLDGGTHTLAGYSSSPVLLMFLACDEAVSIALGPSVQADIQSVYHSRGLRILGIDTTTRPREAVLQYRNQTGVLFPLLLAGGPTKTVYGVVAVSFVLVGSDGIVRYVSVGPDANAYDRAALVHAVQEALVESNETKEATWGRIKSLYAG